MATLPSIVGTPTLVEAGSGTEFKAPAVPSGTAVGNLLIMAVMAETDKAPTPIITTPTGWTLQGSRAESTEVGSQFSSYVFTRKYEGEAMPTVKSNENLKGWYIAIIAVENQNISAPINAFVGLEAIASSTTAVPAEMTTTANTCLGLCLIMNDDGATASAATGWTGEDKNLAFGIFHKELAVSGAQGKPSFGTSSGHTKVVGMMAIAPEIPVTKSLLVGDATATYTHADTLEVGRIMAFQFTAKGGGMLEELQFLTNGTTNVGVNGLDIGILEESSGHPGEVIAHAVAVGTEPAAELKRIAINTWITVTGLTAELVGGKKYWLAILPKGTAGKSLNFNTSVASGGTANQLTSAGSRTKIEKEPAENWTTSSTEGPIGFQALGKESSSAEIAASSSLTTKIQEKEKLPGTVAATASLTAPVEVNSKSTTLLIGSETLAEGYGTEVTAAAGKMQGAHFIAKHYGVLESIKIKTGATANTCKKLRVGIITREGEIPKGVEPASISSFFRPAAVVAEGVFEGTPGVNATITIAGFSAELFEGVAYFLVVLPIEGTFHFKAQNITGKQLAASKLSTFTKLGKTLEWESGSAKGPIEIQGFGNTFSGVIAGANWLGLMGNHGYTFLGAFNDFSKHGILWDRGNELEVEAGSTVATGVKKSLEDGMKPIFLIEYAGYETGAKLPVTTAEVETYGKEFVKTAKAIREALPGEPILFEIINEPYFAKENSPALYAALVEEAFIQCEAAGIPLNVLLVSGRGKEWITGMYAAKPNLETKVVNWSLHPYGGGGTGTAENWNAQGVESLPAMVAEIKSGKENIYVTEFGWWVEGINGAVKKEPPEAASATQAAEWLDNSLKEAWIYHSRGWLKAFMIYSRGAGGFGMEEAGSKITLPGQELINFAATLEGSLTGEINAKSTLTVNLKERDKVSGSIAAKTTLTTAVTTTKGKQTIPLTGIIAAKTTLAAPITVKTKNEPSITAVVGLTSGCKLKKKWKLTQVNALTATLVSNVIVRNEVILDKGEPVTFKLKPGFVGVDASFAYTAFKYEYKVKEHLTGEEIKNVEDEDIKQGLRDTGMFTEVK